jgi:hypothetical protein
MNRILRIAGVALGIAFTLAMTAYALANAGLADKMVGIVVSRSNAALEIKDQPGSTGTIIVDSVTVPGPSWIVVHIDMDGKPGPRIGLLAIPAGTSTGVVVPIDMADVTDKVIVALHADHGVAGTFDFNMKAFDTSPDKPYFVDGKELAREVVVR